MVRRFGRLWPLHMAMLLAFGGFYLVTLRFRGLEMGYGKVSVASFFTNIALIHSLGFHDWKT
jgi:peptidoglycan/LPS O-acetylase OafA/YrhL